MYDKWTINLDGEIGSYKYIYTDTEKSTGG